MHARIVAPARTDHGATTQLETGDTDPMSVNARMYSRTGCRTVRRLAGGAATLACTALVAGCDGGDQLPPDAELFLSPQTRSVDIGDTFDAEAGCTFDANRFVDLPIVMSLRAGNGSPIGDAEVSLYLDWSGQTFPGFSALSLYEDRNGNGIVDADSELVSGRDDAIARVRLDDETGSHAMIVRMNLSCPFRGELFAFTGPFTAQASFEVMSAEIVDPEDEVEGDEIEEDDAPEGTVDDTPVEPVDPATDTDPVDEVEPIDGPPEAPIDDTDPADRTGEPVNPFEPEPDDPAVPAEPDVTTETDEPDDAPECIEKKAARTTPICAPSTEAS